MIILGDAAVGKTNILNRFINNNQGENYIMTFQIQVPIEELRKRKLFLAVPMGMIQERL